MTCVDANYFLRALTEPTSPLAHRHHQTAIELFESASRGEVEFTATEVVLLETLYVLTAKTDRNGYGLHPSEACARLRPLIDLPAFKHPNKRLILVAFDLWSDHPHLGFSDSLTAAHAQHHQMSLATFDADFDSFPGLIRYRLAA